MFKKVFKLLAVYLQAVIPVLKPVVETFFVGLFAAMVGAGVYVFAGPNLTLAALSSAVTAAAANYVTSKARSIKTEDFKRVALELIDALAVAKGKESQPATVQVQIQVPVQVEASTSNGESK